MRSLRGHCLAFGLAAIAASLASAAPAAAGGAIYTQGSVHGSGTLSIGLSTLSGGTSSFGGFSGGQSSSSTPSAPGSPWAPTYGNGTNAPLNLSGSSEGSSSGGSGSGGGGLVWGEPLSADVATFGKVHTNLRYFSQTGYNGTQQAVGVNFTLRY